MQNKGRLYDFEHFRKWKPSVKGYI